MESNEFLKDQLKKTSQELSGHKAELHQNRGYLQCILQNSNDIIFATDVGGIIISFSKGGEKALGYTRDEAVGRLVHNLAEHPEQFQRLIENSRENGSSSRLEVAFRHKKGNRVYCDVTLINLTNTEGRTVATVGICRDITQWKKFQEDLIQVDRLAEIGRIASGVAHEINNPLAIISEVSGWAQTILSDAEGLSTGDKKELETAVKDIREQVGRCRNITHQLLGFARGASPTKKNFDVNKLLNETLSLLEPEIKANNISIIRNFWNGGLTISSDSNMLEQVFVNLINNAVYAIREKGAEGGQIHLNTNLAHNKVEIRISDTGAGIKKGEDKCIFNLFYTTKPPGKGTGLGLPICRNIVDKLGGKITFESREGEGTTFAIEFPVE